MRGQLTCGACVHARVVAIRLLRQRAEETLYLSEWEEKVADFFSSMYDSSYF
jgi:hypothetical protein